MAGGLFWIATLAITASKPEHSRRGPGGFTVLLLAALILMGVGAVGVHLRQRHRSGLLGTIAIIMAGAGVALTVLGRVAVDIVLVPDLVFLAGFLTLLLGLMLFVVSVFLAKVMPRWTVVLLVVGVLGLAVFNFGDQRIWVGVFFGAAWISLGYALWTGSSTAPE